MYSSLIYRLLASLLILTMAWAMTQLTLPTDQSESAAAEVRSVITSER
ncbi:MAG: hypothetical protein M3220_15160 [Chloroflexota bacterium]|nr:hypothetical protein [Chloroflexota bacterium]